MSRTAWNRPLPAFWQSLSGKTGAPLDELWPVAQEGAAEGNRLQSKGCRNGREEEWFSAIGGVCVKVDGARRVACCAGSTWSRIVWFPRESLLLGSTVQACFRGDVGWGLNCQGKKCCYPGSRYSKSDRPEAMLGLLKARADELRVDN